MRCLDLGKVIAPGMQLGKVPRLAFVRGSEDLGREQDDRLCPVAEENHSSEPGVLVCVGVDVDPICGQRRTSPLGVSQRA